MKQLANFWTCFLMILFQTLSHNPIATADNPIFHRKNQNATNGLSSSRWLKKVTINQRPAGCWNRPWICKEGEFSPNIKKLCCKNRCVDVTSDVNNCGLCGIRCPFTWQCCRGICIDTNVNPFHCGSCDHKCPFLSFCIYGMCGYAQPLPPFPFPIPPIPFPPKPPHPFPPKPPFPFPPKPPHPFPPKPPYWPPVRGQPPPSSPLELPPLHLQLSIQAKFPQRPTLLPRPYPPTPLAHAHE